MIRRHPIQESTNLSGSDQWLLMKELNSARAASLSKREVCSPPGISTKRLLRQLLQLSTSCRKIGQE
jgi:hypothetical protein